MDAKIATGTNHRVFGQRPVSSSNIVCRFWKTGKCNRNLCRFLHSDLPPLNNNVFLRTPKPSNSNPLLKEQLGRRSNYGPKNPVALSDGFENQCSQKIIDHIDATKQPPKRKAVSVSTTETDAPEDKRRIQMPPKAQKISNPIVDYVPKKHTETKTSLDLTTEGDTPEIKGTSSVSTTECNVIETSLVSTSPEFKAVEKGTIRVCVDWMFGTCVRGDDCQFFHTWYSGDWFSMLGKLGGHEQAVSGITLPLRSDKLLTGSNDSTVHVWDCHTGKTTRVISLGDEIGSLISEGPWTFVGLPNVIKAWNLETGTDLSLNGHSPFGQVYALAVAKETLFAGAQDGSILVWRGRNENPMPFQLSTSLNGHTAAVICLIVGDKEERLYSGSIDSTIRAWDVDTLECVHTLNGHTDAVTSVICWENFLLSCSLDQTIKAWAYESGSLEVIYTHNLEHGAVTLCGLLDAENKPILCCSCIDNSVYLYDLPSFNVRGRIFSKEEVRTIQAGPEGLFFTGDKAGLVTVWKIDRIMREGF